MRHLRCATAPWLLLLGTGSCGWIELARNAATYAVVERGPANVATNGSLFYATLAHDGIAIVEPSGRTAAVIAPPAGSETVDDLAVADDLLFVLDARPPGYLSVLSLRDPRRPHLVSGPHPVPVGPFSGVSANGGLCIVSGGTSPLTAWRYTAAGLTRDPPASADLGRGQPDVTVSLDGRSAYVSAHYWGPYFGLNVLRYEATTHNLEPAGRLPLEGAGFTAGGAKPANFPLETATLGPDTVLVAHAHGVTVVDVSRTERPRALTTLAFGGPAVNVDALDGVALVAVGGPTPAAVLLDLRRGGAVARRFALPPGTIPAGVALTATHAAVAIRDRGVQLFER